MMITTDVQHASRLRCPIGPNIRSTQNPSIYTLFYPFIESGNFTSENPIRMFLIFAIGSVRISALPVVENGLMVKIVSA